MTASEPSIDCRRFADRVGSWLKPGGPDVDVVISSRVRLARNIDGFPFVTKLAEDKAGELCDELRGKLEELELGGDTIWVSMAEANPVLRLCLRERHLVSRDLAPSGGRRQPLPGRAVAFGSRELLAIMVNEEDHLRIQSMAAGFDLEGAWREARRIDRELEGCIDFSHTERFGYLTGCPTNVGTGLRASVMLHLPALGLVRSELEKVFAAAQRTGLAVRGLYGEGSRAAGDFYQISNQVTLGRSEEDLIRELRNLVPAIVRFERTVRNQLLHEQRAALTDRVSRSYGILRTTRAMPTDGALQHLSNLRLGSYLGLWSAIAVEELNRLRIQIQKGHLQALAGGLSGAERGHRSEPGPAASGEPGSGPSASCNELLEASERDRLRANFLRQRLAER